MFSRIKKIRKLEESFGKIKDDQFEFESIERYFQKKDKADAFQIISDKICNDLDFNEVFKFLDRTISKVGQQFFYNMLRTVPKDRNKFVVQEQLIKELQLRPQLVFEIQNQLAKLSDYKSFYITYLFQDEHIKPPRWFFIIRILSLSSILSILLLTIFPQFLFVLLGIFIINMGIHYWNKRNLYEYIGPIPQLLKLNEVSKKLIKYELFKVISKDLQSSINTIDKVKNHMTFFRLEAKLESDFEMAFWFMLEVVKTLFLLEPILLFSSLKKLDTRRTDIERVFSFIGYIDSIISIISLRQGVKNYCIPEINSINKSITGINLYHPLITNCITNSIITDGKSILLTGSNMSGKTTFIRIVGINTITASTINTCFASQFKIPILKIHSAIRLSDDLMNDKSYFFEEVLTIKSMIEQSQTNNVNLFLLDEIFKGTNTIERISAGKAVLSELSKNGNIVFVSTHDIELATLLHVDFEMYHFNEQIKNSYVDFNYKLKNGISSSKNAIMILKIHNYPESIITEALKISKNFKSLLND